MKKVYCRLFILVMTASFLAGCQATPEQEIVIQKDLEQMIEKAVAQDDTATGASLADSLSVPATYSASINGYNGDLTVNVNATVTVPDSDGISVMRIGKHDFTQEEADKMIEVLLQGETLYEIDLSLTKEEIQEKLIMYYGMRDGSIPLDMDGENPDDGEKLQQVIADYEALLATAPETKEPIAADTLFHTPETLVNPNAQVIEGTATVNGKAAYLYINNGFFSDNDIEAVFINGKPSLGESYNNCPYSVLSDEQLSGVQIPETFAMSKVDAQSAAEGILDRLGITDMTCVDIQYAVMSEDFATGNVALEPGTVIEPEQIESGKWAYSLQYQRTVNGIPVTLTGHSGHSVSDENDMSVPWPYEHVNIIVDETGVVYFDYLSPCSILDTVTEDATLKQFSEIQSVFEKMFPITYGHLDEEGTDYQLQVEITEVRLGLMRITEQNSRDTGLLVPVWDFFGDVIVIPEEGDPYLSISDSLITINAIDGSIIERELGY